jgi:tetratricopeptide (TPR) repeat protein
MVCFLSLVGVLAVGAPVHAQAVESAPPSTAARAEAYHAFILGRAHESAGDIEAAVSSFTRAAELDPTASDIWAELAGLYARRSEAEPAIEAASTALDLEPDNLEAHRILGLVYAARAGARSGGDAADLDRAIEHLERARKPLSPDPALYLTLGRLYLTTENADKAIEVLEEVVDAEPQFADALALLAQAHEAKGDWEEASAVYERAVLVGPGRVRYRRQLASALVNAGQPERALDVLRDLVQIRPDDAAGWYALSGLELQLRNSAEAETAVRRVIELEPEGLRGPYLLTQILGAQSRYQELTEVLGSIVERAAIANVDPSQVASLLQRLAAAHDQLGNHDAAIGALSSALDLSPSDLGVQAQLAQVYIAAERFDDAGAIVEQGQRQRPDNLMLSRLEAMLLTAQGEVRDAVEVLRDALQQHQEEPAAHVALANLYSEHDQVDDAVRVLRGAEEQFPNNTQILFQLGAVFERGQRFTEAEAAFRRVLEREPNDAQALNYLGYMLAERNDRLDESVQLIQRALEIDPDNGSYLDSLGWAYFKKDELDLAETALRRASDQLLRNSVVQDHLADLLFKIERYEEAVMVWERALAGDRDGVDVSGIERKLGDARARLRD